MRSVACKLQRNRKVHDPRNRLLFLTRLLDFHELRVRSRSRKSAQHLVHAEIDTCVLLDRHRLGTTGIVVLLKPRTAKNEDKLPTYSR